MRIKPQQIPPPELIAAIEARLRLRYTSLNTLYHALEVFPETWVAVAGDGDNGSYEWFVWTVKDGVIRHSDDAIGSPEFALRYALEDVLS